MEKRLAKIESIVAGIAAVQETILERIDKSNGRLAAVERIAWLGVGGVAVLGLFVLAGVINIGG